MPSLILICKWVAMIFFGVFSIYKLFTLWFRDKRQKIHWCADDGTKCAQASKISEALVYVWVLLLVESGALMESNFKSGAELIFVSLIPLFVLIGIFRFRDEYVFKKQKRKAGP